MSSETYPVAIVGGGPIGLSTSILLSQLNIPHVLFERFPDTSIHPKSVGHNHRSVEIYRRMGIEEAIIKNRAPKSTDCQTAWYTSFGPNGREIVTRDSWGGGAYVQEYAELSPCQYSMMPQIRLEPVLKERALELNPDKIFYNAEVTRVEEHDDHVIVTYQRKGEAAPESVRARYCIGADGGRSLTNDLGIGWEGDRNIIDMVSAHVRAPISQHHADIRNFITWFINPKLGGTIGSGFLYHLGPYPITPDTEEWLFACGQRPDDPKRFDEAAMLRRMQNTLQIPDLDVKILSLSHWFVDALCANRYRSKRATGRVFLVGDAAHHIPPWGGLGLNTGVQDVYNLVWKLNFAINGIPGTLGDGDKGADLNALLDSYDTERRPIGQRARDGSLYNMRAIGLVMDHALGITMENTRAENEAHMVSFFDKSPTNTDGAGRREAVHRAQKALDAEFHALGAEIGWFYPELDTEREGDATLHDGQLKPDGQFNVTEYRPSTIPGHHLPHAWLERGDERLSTRDLVPYDRFVLITSRPDLWAVTGEDILVSVVPVADQSPAMNGEKPPLYSASVWTDVDGKWAALRGVGSSGAVLVRPDGIVVWRAKEFSQEKHSGKDWLKKIVRKALKLV